VRWRGGASLNINDDDLTIGRNQYQHHASLGNDCWPGAEKRAERSFALDAALWMSRELGVAVETEAGNAKGAPPLFVKTLFEIQVQSVSSSG
jgi:hypothetical protein